MKNENSDPKLPVLRSISEEMDRSYGTQAPTIAPANLKAPSE